MTCENRASCSRVDQRGQDSAMKRFRMRRELASKRHLEPDTVGIPTCDPHSDQSVEGNLVLIDVTNRARSSSLRAAAASFESCAAITDRLDDRTDSEIGGMPDEPRLLRRTDFEWRCVVGAIDTDVGDYATELMLGLPLSQTFLYGTLRDGDGRIWNPMRRLTAGDGGHEKFLLQTDLDSDAIHIHRAGRHSASGFGARRSFDGNTLRFASDPSAEGAPFEVHATSTTFHWSEEGTLELEGTAVPPGLHWHLPDRDRGMYYLSQVYEVAGTVLGREVRGFIPMDQLWMKGVIYEDDIFVGRQAEVVWYTWATRYVDGSFEGGHFLLGHRRLGFAVVYDERGNVFSTTNVDGKVTLESDGSWPARIDLQADDQQWEFVPAETGRMVDLMPIPNPQIEGRWRRRGDERVPAHWSAWGEIAPSHGTAPRRASTGSEDDADLALRP
jgi:hypothetical protein